MARTVHCVRCGSVGRRTCASSVASRMLPLEAAVTVAAANSCPVSSRTMLGTASRALRDSGCR